MIAALATLAFLATLWLVAVLALMVLEQSGAKIAAALKGRAAPLPVRTPTVRLRIRQPMTRPVRATPRLRAAA